jgi:hypothetical protein
MAVIKLLLYKWFGLEDFPCESCETLKMQLDIANHERRQLLETIIGFTKPAVVEVDQNPRIIQPILPRTVPWRMRQQKLEENDRLTAETLKKKQQDIDALEKEVGVEEKKEESNAS